MTWYNREIAAAFERSGGLLPHAQAPQVAAMTRLDVRLLGEFAISSDGAPVTTIKSQRLQCLLAYLLLHRDAPIARQRLAFLFWPDSSEAQARSNLRNLIHALIQALPDGEHFIETDNQTVQWRAGTACSTDVDVLHTTLSNARTENDLQHALDLYQGPLLPCCYDDWIAPERERLEQMLADVLQRFIDEWEKQGNYRDAITYAQKLVRRDPLREDIYRQIMRLYATSGDRAGVARTFKECRAVLARELDVEPSQQTRDAYERYLRLEPAGHSPIAPAPAAPTPEQAPESAAPLPPVERETVTAPSGGDPALADRQIRRAVLSEALQHPATEIPLAFTCVVGIFLLLIEPVLGLGAMASYVALGLGSLSGLTAAGSFIWRYVLNFDQAYAEKSQVLREQQQRSSQQREQAGLAQVRARLTEGFRETRLAEGHYVLRDLDYEFKELKAVIARHKETDPLTLSYLPTLVDETFRQGLSVLDDALELARATSSPHDQRLEAEIQDLESKIRENSGKKNDQERAKLWQEKLDVSRRRLELIGKERLRLEGLLQQATKCEAALHETRIQVASLKADTWTVSVNTVLETLQKTIDQAKAVQEEMRKLGY